MAYGDIPDLVFTTDSDGNVIYSSGTTPTTTTPGTSTTGKKWWESLIGTIPALATAIFGNRNTTNVPIYTPTTGTNTSANNSMMMIVIIAAVLVLFLLMQKRK